ncbi:MAG: Fis family transcriptional regulator [Betaproteobacteria bacterium]
MRERTNRHVGTRFFDFLAQQATAAETTAAAVKEVIAWQVAQAMEQGGLSKTAMAQRMQTSRQQLDRLLDPHNTSVTLQTLQRAARAVGRELKIELA